VTTSAFRLLLTLLLTLGIFTPEGIKNTQSRRYKRGLSHLITRRPNEDTHARATTEKSSQFHGSRRYVNSERMRPRAMIRVTLSAV